MLTMITMIGAMPIVSAAHLKLVDCSVYSRPRHPCTGIGNKDHKCTYQRDFVRGNSGKIKGHMDVYEFHPAPPVALYIRDHPGTLAGNENVDGLFVRGDKDKAEAGMVVGGGLRYYLPIYYRSVATHFGTDLPKYFIIATCYRTNPLWGGYYRWQIRKTRNDSRYREICPETRISLIPTDEATDRRNAFGFASNYVTPIRNKEDIDDICHKFPTISMSVWRGGLSKMMQKDEHVEELESLLPPGNQEMDQIAFMMAQAEAMQQAYFAKNPLSQAARKELAQPEVIKHNDLKKLMYKTCNQLKNYEFNFGLHVPGGSYITLSEKTIKEIYNKRMMVGDKRRFDYVTGQFVCRDYGTYFTGVVRAEQVAMKTKLPLCVAEVWTTRHVFNLFVAVTPKNEYEVIYFEPQNGKFKKASDIFDKEKGLTHAQATEWAKF